MAQLEKATSSEKLTVLNTMPKSRNPHKFTAKLKPIFPNITKEETNALYSLRKDDGHMVHTTGKGIPLAIIDKEMKFIALFNDENIYHECRDLTKSIYSKVIKQLLDLKHLSN